eukprot:NODE_6373_length_542_cov_25.253012_g6208_i0.p1 GENE.NODE_6373_length_542_cov_25.253012_g6208_i0~~NODE_6373_length_542_cov_25.253012_g6208_i0.p1  ORF type:complete len:159 (+),score=59.38 NODE_6373_length_542_cov_25.253012_g6208_i0:59-478(+)
MPMKLIKTPWLRRKPVRTGRLERLKEEFIAEGHAPISQLLIKFPKAVVPLRSSTQPLLTLNEEQDLHCQVKHVNLILKPEYNSPIIPFNISPEAKLKRSDLLQTQLYCQFHPLAYDHKTQELLHAHPTENEILSSPPQL